MGKNIKILFFVLMSWWTSCGRAMEGDECKKNDTQIADPFLRWSRNQFEELPDDEQYELLEHVGTKKIGYEDQVTMINKLIEAGGMEQQSFRVLEEDSLLAFNLLKKHIGGIIHDTEARKVKKQPLVPSKIYTHMSSLSSVMDRDWQLVLAVAIATDVHLPKHGEALSKNIVSVLKKNRALIGAVLARNAYL